MAETARYASFIVRLWREPVSEAADQEAPVWMDSSSPIQTGHVWQFQGVAALADLLAAQLLAAPSQPDETDDIP